MKLRKMITVSAAALMLAGFGATAVNATPAANASRLSVRMSHLNGQRAILEARIHKDQAQVRKISREMARISHPTVRRHKRSKMTVKRHKRAKKHVNRKANAKKAASKQQAKMAKAQKEAAAKQKAAYDKMTPAQKQQYQQQQAQRKKVMQQIQKQMQAQQEKQRYTQHVLYGRKVYEVTYNGLGKVLSKKYVTSYVNFAKKNARAYITAQKSLDTLQKSLNSVQKQTVKAAAKLRPKFKGVTDQAKIQQITNQLKPTKDYQTWQKLYNKLQKLQNNVQKVNQQVNKHALYYPPKKSAKK